MTRFRPDRSTVVFSSALALLMLLLLIGPRVPDADQAAHCVVNVNLPGPFGLSLNCDSPEFMQLASDPARLLDPGNERQSRPGLIYAAAILTWMMQPLTPMARWLGVGAQREDIDPRRIAGALESYPPAFVSYVLLNVLLLMAAFHYLRRIVAPDGVHGRDYFIVVLSIALILIANDLVKVFAWSPHTQMFNILVPVLGVFLALSAGAADPPSRRFAVGMGLVTGWGVTAYALFVILIPAFVVPAVLRCFAGARGEVRARLVDAALFTFFAVAPFLGWYLLVKAVAGSFYHYEIALGQVVWMEQAYTERGIPGVVAGLVRNLRDLGAMAVDQALPLAALVVWVALVATYSRASLGAMRPLRNVMAAALFVCVLVAVFYASTGFIIQRLAYPMLPPLIAAAGFGATAISEKIAPPASRALALGCLAIALVALAAMILKSPQRL